MQAASTSKRQTPVITLSGALDFASRKTLRALVEDGLAQGQGEFILDLHQVTFIDSSGLGALVACFGTVRKQGGSLRLTRVPTHVYELLEMTRLTHFFDLSESPQPPMADQGVEQP